MNRLRRRLVTKFGIQQALTVDRLGPYKFYCRNQTELFRTQDYGGETLSLAAFLFLLKEEDIVWDVGASVGLLTVHSAGIAKQVVAFEPDPATNRRLQQNVELNRLSGKVRFKNCALSDQEGTHELHTDGLAGNAPTLKSLGRHSQVAQVQVRTIDKVVASGIPAPTVLKIDIEGAEIAAIKGARQLLHSKVAPRLLFVEIHPEFLKSYSATPDDVLKLITDAGYHLLLLRPEHGQFHVVATR